jgi:ATP synthase protein I
VTNKKDDEGFSGPLWRETLVAMSLGWDLALPIFGGVLLGYLLDRWLGTGHVFTMGLLVLGIAIGYYNLARFIQRVDQRSQRQEAEAEAEDRAEDKEKETG